MKDKRFLLILVIMIVIVAAIAVKTQGIRGKIDYAKYLDEKVLCVDEKDVKLREMAFYIAYEELEVEKQAVIYDAEDPGKYWETHTNGVFIKLSARQAALDMGIHDVLFEELAEQEGLQLETEEINLIKSKTEDFWAGLTEDQKEKIGIDKDELEASMHRVAMAQKYQNKISKEQDRLYEEYDFNGDSYKEILKEHDVEVKEDIWKNLDFGNIILEHGKDGK